MILIYLLLISFRKNNYQLIVKSHPLYGENYDKMLKGISHISLFPDEKLKEWKIDLYEVLGATDFLITDYSSVYFDYLLLNKPIIFTPTDLEEYNEDRGFLLTPYEEWTPDSKVFDQISLQSEILAYETNHSYYQKRENKLQIKSMHIKMAILPKGYGNSLQNYIYLVSLINR